MDKQKINKFFCVQPFINTTTRVGGENNVCCNTSDSNSNLDKESPAEFFNSDYVKNFRLKLLNGEKLSACGVCHYQERLTGNSQRKQYNAYFNIKDNQTIQYYHNILKNLKMLDRKNPIYAEMHVSNLCNLKCLTCFESDSSRFHAENKLLNISKNPYADYSIFKSDRVRALETLLTKDLLFLELRGGETFLVPEVKQVLSNISPDIAKKITLMLSTNGTILPDENWTKIFKKFKRTKVNVSIDAYGDDNHYIRYPADWKRILKTIDYLQTHGIKFIITTVVSNLNILLLDKLMKWVQSNQYLNYAYILEEPAHFRPTNLPKSLLDLAVERLHNIDRNNFANKDTGKDIDNLIDMCKNSGTTEDWQRFCTEIQMRDKFRKINIVNVIPEIKEYMNA